MLKISAAQSRPLVEKTMDLLNEYALIPSITPYATRQSPGRGTGKPLEAESSTLLQLIDQNRPSISIKYLSAGYGEAEGGKSALCRCKHRSNFFGSVTVRHVLQSN